MEVTKFSGDRENSVASVVPDAVMDSVHQTLSNIELVQTHMQQLISLCDPQVLSEMPPLERAQSLLLLAKTTTTLFALKLRCTGVDPNDHPVKSELERLSLYQEKLERFVNLSKAPLRPSTTLNYQAATRFIGHSLPDLTPEQRQSMRDLSRGERPGIERSYHKKRKHSSSDRPSVQTLAKEFLEKASREILGNNSGGIKGPIQFTDDDDDNNDTMPLQ